MNTFTAILLHKCPQCSQGDLFIHSGRFSFNKAVLMPAQCPVCGLNFKPEAGFYWGALYVSYAMAVGLSLLLFALIYLFWGWQVWPFLIADTVMLIVFAPQLMRFSRTVWVYLNYKFFKSAWRN